MEHVVRRVVGDAVGEVAGRSGGGTGGGGRTGGGTGGGGRSGGGTGGGAPSAGLVARLRSGSPAAWEEVTERFTPVLRWVAVRHRLVAEDCDDVVQTTWLRLWENLDRLRDPEALAGWLMTTCRRESLRTMRVRARQVPQDPADPVWSIAATDGRGDPFALVERRLAAAALYSALDDLPRRQRSLVLAMLGHDGASYAETSRLLRIPVGSVGPTRQRAFARLRRDPRLVRRTWEHPAPNERLARVLP